jgi:hypothetical protein
MQVIRESDGDGVEVRLFQQFVIINVTAGHVMSGTGFASALGVGFGNGDGRCTVTGGETVKMVEADPPGSNDRTAKLVCHKCPWEMSTGVHG